MHFTSPQFWKHYQQLPENLQRLADKNYNILKTNPRHPSLQFKKVGRYWSARVGSDHRALAVPSGDDLVWFWIGSHAEYDRIVG